MQKRRRILVEGFQAEWAITLVAWFGLAMAAFLALLFGPLIVGILVGNPAPADLEAATAFLALHDRIWLPLGALFLGLTYIVIRLTHRVAGPLYRFRVVFREVANGNLGVRAGIRAGDYLHQESRELEEALASLRARVARAQAATSALDEGFDRLGDGFGRIDVTELARLRLQASEARASLAQFSLEPGADDRPALEPESSLVGEAGFTLLELLIASAITMTIAALAMPAYTGALYRARVTRAVGDINAIGKEVVMHQVSRNCFPATLVDVDRGWMKDPWGQNYQYAVPRAPGGRGGGGGGGSCGACGGGCVPPGAARKDHNLVPINSDFDLYSTGRDRSSAPPLTANHSKDDIVRGRSGSFIGLASEY